MVLTVMRHLFRSVSVFDDVDDRNHNERVQHEHGSARSGRAYLTRTEPKRSSSPASATRPRLHHFRQSLNANRRWSGPLRAILRISAIELLDCLPRHGLIPSSCNRFRSQIVCWSRGPFWDLTNVRLIGADLQRVKSQDAVGDAGNLAIAVIQLRPEGDSDQPHLSGPVFRQQVSLRSNL